MSTGDRPLRNRFTSAIRTALRSSSVGSASTPTVAMGVEPEVPLDKALRLAAELEDDELIGKLAEHK